MRRGYGQGWALHALEVTSKVKPYFMAPRALVNCSLLTSADSAAARTRHTHKMCTQPQGRMSTDEHQLHLNKL